MGIEEEKLRLERERFEFEKVKFQKEGKRAIASTLATVGAVVISAVTLGITFYINQRQQETQALLGAISSAFQEKTAWEVSGRLQAMARVLGDRLSPEMIERMRALQPDDDSSPNRDMRLELLRLMAHDPAKRSEIVDIWLSVFPNDAWAWEIKRVMSTPLAPE